MIDKLTKLKK